MRIVLVSLIAVFLLSGCTGAITGHQYTVGDATTIYKVVKGGVTTFMTKEQIQDAGLDKVNDVVIKTYKAVDGTSLGKSVATKSKSK